MPASRVAPTAKAMLVSSTRPFGHHGDQAGHRALHGLHHADVQSASWALTSRMAVGIISQPTTLMTRLMPVRSSLFTSEKRRASLGELEGVGVGTDAGGPDAAAPGDHEAARQHLVADRLGDRVGLAGEQRLVDLEARLLEHHAVDDAPGRRAGGSTTSSWTSSLDGDLDHHAVAADVGLGGVEQRQSVEGPLGPELLDDADERRWRPARCRTGRRRYSPTARMTTRRMPSRKLNGVTTLARMIWATVRLVGSSARRWSARRHGAARPRPW